MSSVGTPTVEPPPTAQATPETTAAVTGYVPTWEQLDAEDIQLAIEVPKGWQAQRTREGLLIAERFGTMQSGTSTPGMQINFFVHSLDGYHLPVTDDANIAWAALKEIVSQPKIIGKAHVSPPTGFDWDGWDAAYYLLNDGDGNLSMLLAVAISNPPRLVVCNFSSPARQASEIRHLLPDILSTLTINGVVMDVAALNQLPDPLDFPDSPPNPYGG